MARKKQETLVLFPEVLAVTRKLSDEQFGVLMRAAFSYRLSGEVYAGDDVAVDVAFQFVSNQIDRYIDNCSTNARNAAGSNAECSEIQRNAPKRQQNPPPILSNPIHSIPMGSRADKPPSHHRFVPPKVEEVRSYCQENGYLAVDPERFINFYQSKGWKVGKESMKDWKAAVRNWNSRDKGQVVQNGGKPLLGYKEGENWTL